jgi:hypothetical protein
MYGCIDLLGGTVVFLDYSGLSHHLKRSFGSFSCKNLRWCILFTYTFRKLIEAVAIGVVFFRVRKLWIKYILILKTGIAQSV